MGSYSVAGDINSSPLFCQIQTVLKPCLAPAFLSLIFASSMQESCRSKSHTESSAFPWVSSWWAILRARVNSSPLLLTWKPKMLVLISCFLYNLYSRNTYQFCSAQHLILLIVVKDWSLFQDDLSANEQFRNENLISYTQRKTNLKAVTNTSYWTSWTSRYMNALPSIN